MLKGKFFMISRCLQKINNCECILPETSLFYRNVLLHNREKYVIIMIQILCVNKMIRRSAIWLKYIRTERL